GHEHHLVVALADQNLRHSSAAIDQDQRGGILGAAIGMMIGFFFGLCSFAHLAPATPRAFLACPSLIYFSGYCSSNPCIRNAHCIPTTAPFTGCSSNNDAISV